MAQTAAALAAAHRRGLVHRDVKPANVLIAREDDEEHSYLTDFGIARDVGADTALTRTGSVVGTLDYLAPERIEGGHGEPPADIYALGCVLFQTLTGEVPYKRDTEAAKMFAHISAAVPSARERRPDTPADLDAITARAMAKSPTDRFASAGEMARALQAVTVELRAGTAGGPPATEPTRAATVPTEPARRRPSRPDRRPSPPGRRLSRRGQRPSRPRPRPTPPRPRQSPGGLRRSPRAQPRRRPSPPRLRGGGGGAIGR